MLTDYDEFFDSWLSHGVDHLEDVTLPSTLSRPQISPPSSSHPSTPSSSMSSQQSNSDSNPRLPKKYKSFPPSSLATKITWGSDDPEASGMKMLTDIFKTEALVIVTNVVNQVNKVRRLKGITSAQPIQSHPSHPSLPLSLSELFDVLFYDIGRILCHRDFELFQGTEEEMMRDFYRFLSDLHVCSVIPVVFSDFNDPDLAEYFQHLPLSLPPAHFHSLLQKIDQLLINDPSILHKLEESFTQTNTLLCYQTTFLMGIDDDKPRIKGTEAVNLPSRPGRTTHTFSRVHETALISTTVTISRSSQMNRETDMQATTRIFETITNTAKLECSLFPNLMIADRGYTASLKAVRRSFGTLKSGRQTGNIFHIDKLPGPKGESPYHFYITSDGTQTLYCAIVERRKQDDQTHQEVQLAFSQGGKVTCMVLPHPETPMTSPFNSKIIGTWYAVSSNNEPSRKVLQIFPEKKTDPPELLTAFPFRFISSSQFADVFWHLGRYGIAFTSRGASTILKELATAKHSLNSQFSSLFELLGFENFLPPQTPSVTPLSPSQFVESQRDKSAFWQILRQLNRKVPLLDRQGNVVSNKYVTGQTALDLMKASANRYFAQNPGAYEIIANSSLERLLIPRILETMVLSPLSPIDLPSFKKGRENERTMALELPTLIHTWSQGRYQVLQVAQTGLVSVESSLASLAATSPDLFLLIRDTATNSNFPCLAELKSSVTDGTKEQLLSTALRNGPFLDLTLSPETFPLLVPDHAHRAQVLHHAACLKVNRILYVRGIYLSPSEQQRTSLKAVQMVSLITIHNDLIQNYMSFLDSVATELQLKKLFNNLEDFPETELSRSQAERLINLDLFAKNGTAMASMNRLRDIHTLGLSLALGRLVRQQELPPPPCKKIIPLSSQLWNWTKSFSDSASRKKEDYKLKFNKGAGSKLVARLLMSQSLNVYKIWNLLEQSQQISEASELQQIRDWLNARHDPSRSFRVFLLKSQKHLRLNVVSPSVSLRPVPPAAYPEPLQATPEPRLSAHTRIKNVVRRYESLGSSTDSRPLHEQHAEGIRVSKRQLNCVECETVRTNRVCLKGQRTFRTRGRCDRFPCNGMPVHLPNDPRHPNCHRNLHLRIEGLRSLPAKRQRNRKNKSSKHPRIVSFRPSSSSSDSSSSDSSSSDSELDTSVQDGSLIDDLSD